MIPKNVRGHTPVILFFHGGGYVSGSIRSHGYFAAELAKRALCKSFIINYRLGPENPLPAAVEDAVFVYKWLLEHHVPAKQIIIAGDSAGGGLTLLTALALRDNHVELPAGLVLISPWLDIAGQGPSYKQNILTDAMISAGLPIMSALGSDDLNLRTDPKFSPIYASSFSGLPPSLVYYGSFERLSSDSIIFAEKARKDGVKVTLEEGSGQQHVYPLFFFLFRRSKQCNFSNCGFRC